MTAATLTRPATGRGSTPTWVMGAALAAGSLVAGLVAGDLTASGNGAGVFALAAVALIVVLWKQPAFSPIVVLVAALTVEQFPFGPQQPGSGSTSPGVTPSDITDRIPLFHGIAKNIHISPADLLLLTVLTIWLLKRGTGVTAPLPRSAVTYGVAAVVVAVAIGLAVGQQHHGSLRTAMTEIRPYAYLAVAYFVASTFATRLSILRAALWAIVLGGGFKAAQAIHSFLAVRHQQLRPDFVVGHEEALFFGLFILLTLSLWLFDLRGALRTTATALLPVVLVADLVNSRRAAWLILGGALIVLAVLSMVAVPARRWFLTRVLVVLALVSVVYFPVFWNHSGALAGPARAVHSAVSPNPRDELSDMYRVQENANLQLNIKQGGFLGKGFGVPIDYALPIADISSIDPLIAYIPHNGVFYILMRMGLLGGIAFWSLLGSGIIAGCRLARYRDRELALFGALLVCGLIGYALEGYNDQGFFMYRIAFVMGSLLGLAEAARRLSATTVSRVAVAPAAPTAAPAQAAAVPAPPPPVGAPVVAPAPPRRLEGAMPTKVASRRRRAERVALLTALVLLPVAVGFLAWLLLAGHGAASVPAAQWARTASIGRTAPARPGATSRPVTAQQTVRLVLRDVRNDSWVEIRRDSQVGPVVHAGVIKSGSTVTVTDSRLWARFGGAGNLEIMLNGKRVTFQGTLDALFTPSGARPQPLRTRSSSPR